MFEGQKQNNQNTGSGDRITPERALHTPCPLEGTLEENVSCFI